MNWSKSRGSRNNGMKTHPKGYRPDRTLSDADSSPVDDVFPVEQHVFPLYWGSPHETEKIVR